MIYGKLDDFEAMGLEALGGAAVQAVAWIRSLPADAAEGRFALAGEDIYALVVRYDTASPAESRFETHRRYVDLQYTLSGFEAIEWAPRDSLENDGEYDAERDVLFHQPGRALVSLLKAPGYFSVFTPVDAHRPKVRVAGAGPEVLKLVVKIAIEKFGSSAPA